MDVLTSMGEGRDALLAEAQAVIDKVYEERDEARRRAELDPDDEEEAAEAGIEDVHLQQAEALTLSQASEE